MKVKSGVYIGLFLLITSFVADKREIEFHYPSDKEAKFYMVTDKFSKFQEEWRGSDYYYMSDDGNEDILCSVLFYKLNKEDQESLVEQPRKMLNAPEKSPLYPLTYFSTNDKLKNFESNFAKWGDAGGDFMFRHVDIKEIDGIRLNQKHMYAYAMPVKDIFVNVHLSKVMCTVEDSIAMREILDGLIIRK